MRSVFCLATALGPLLLMGCAHQSAPSLTAPPPARTDTTGTNAPAASKLIVTPEFGLTGKVVLTNPNLRFVVLNFPVGQMPAADQRMNVYRRGLKVGEVKVNAQPLDDNVAADIVAGEAAVGDVVRDR